MTCTVLDTLLSRNIVDALGEGRFNSRMQGALACGLSSSSPPRPVLVFAAALTRDGRRLTRCLLLGSSAHRCALLLLLADPGGQRVGPLRLPSPEDALLAILGIVQRGLRTRQ